jgi:hypothetical protein
MALKKVNESSYIKIELDGSFKIYRSSLEREKEKQASSFVKINSLYRSILKQLRENKERQYYDPEFCQLLYAWEFEYNKYTQAHYEGKHAEGFPLMSKYFPDIENSLPDLVIRGRAGVIGNTLEEVYTNLKNCGYFGEVEDC